MAAYNIVLEEDAVLRVGFGDPAQNDQIVREAKAALDDLVAAGKLGGGGVLRVNGPASLPVAFTIAHATAHLYAAVACFDPKMGGYVVAISHDPHYGVGDLIID